MVKLKHLAWVVGIMTAFVAWLGMELVAVLDGASWTEPFTDIVVGFLPAGVGIPLVTGFSVWMMVHFISRWLGHPVLWYDDGSHHRTGETGNGKARQRPNER